MSEKSIQLLTAPLEPDLKDGHKIGLNSLQLNSNLLQCNSNITASDFQQSHIGNDNAFRPGVYNRILMLTPAVPGANDSPVFWPGLLRDQYHASD